MRKRERERERGKQNGSFYALGSSEIKAKVFAFESVDLVLASIPWRMKAAQRLAPAMHTAHGVSISVRMCRAPQCHVRARLRVRNVDDARLCVAP